MPESFKVLVKELQSLGLDVRLYDNENELELKEEIEDAIDFNIEEQKKMISGENDDVLLENEIEENYVEDEESDTLMDDDDLEDDNDKLFGELDDEDEDFLMEEDLDDEE